MSVGRQRHTPAALSTLKRLGTWVQEVGGGVPGLVWTDGATSPLPPGFDPLTVQPVASLKLSTTQKDECFSRNIQLLHLCGATHHLQITADYKCYSLNASELPVSSPDALPYTCYTLP
jgi:hypothetical protein